MRERGPDDLQSDGAVCVRVSGWRGGMERLAPPGCRLYGGRRGRDLGLAGQRTGRGECEAC